MKILGIETSCDETAASVIKGDSNGKNVKLLSNVVTTSLPLYKKTGGIVPETAAREQIKYIIPVINQAIGKAFKFRDSIFRAGTRKYIDAIAVTVGPGLIGSLLVGVETAKTLAFILNKPIIPVNHLFGHVYANFVGKIHNSEFRINNSIADINFSAVALVVSGGHTDLILMRNHGDIKWLGGTRDDAAGEAFDKIGRLLKLPYPGGPAIEKAAKIGNPKSFKFPRPLIDSKDFDFSFSGLKTAVFREIKTMKELDNEKVANISASVQQAIIDVLIFKTLKAAKKYKVKSILLGGGVTANQKLRNEFKWKMENGKWKIKLFAPQKFLCTDNAAMIATAAFFNYKPLPWQKITVNPDLYFI